MLSKFAWALHKSLTVGVYQDISITGFLWGYFLLNIVTINCKPYALGMQLQQMKY